MKFLLSVILIALLSAGAELFLPWWSVAVVSFLVAVFMRPGSGRAFMAGFMGVSVFWLVAAIMRDAANEHILSGKMAVLFHLPNYAVFIAVTVLIGGLVGGLGAWAGAVIRPKADNL